MEKDKDIAIRAREIISAEGSWTKGAEARRADGSGIRRELDMNPAASEEAVAWSLYGALNKARDEILEEGDSRTEIGQTVNNKCYEVYGVSMASLNDSPNARQDVVIDILDEVIASY